jgi:hypothetical protein
VFRGARRIVLLGALIGGLVGGLVAWIYARQWTEGGEQRRWGLQWRQVARLAALIVGLLRQIAEMGQR